MEAFVFYPFAALALLGAVGVVTLSKPVHALLSLILTMFSLAFLFLLLKAYFLAMVHLIVYAGAVLVLFLFVIMLLGIEAREVGAFPEYSKKGFLGLIFFVPIAFLALLLFLATTLRSQSLYGVQGTAESFGRLLFTRYLLAFELVSFLLLIGVFAAVMLASSRSEEKR